MPESDDAVGVVAPSEFGEREDSERQVQLPTLYDSRKKLPLTREELEDAAKLENLMRSFRGYAKGQRPRAGTVVRDPIGHTAVVLGVAYSDDVLLACESCNQINITSPEKLRTLPGFPRHSLRRVLLRTCQLLHKKPARTLLLVLINHLNGANGAQYRDPVALGYAVLAAYEWAQLGGLAHLRDFARELVDEMRSAGEDPAKLPSQIQALAEMSSEDAVLADVPADSELPTHVEKIKLVLTLLAYSLEDDGRWEDEQQAEVPVGAMGLDLITGEDVLVLGQSVVEPELNFVDVIGSWTSEAYVAHVDDLSLDEPPLSLDSFELVDIVQGAVHQVQPAACWFLQSHSLLAAPDRLIHRVLLSAMAMRASCKEYPAFARRAHKQMHALAKELDKDQKRRAIAWVPELVNPKAKKDVIALGKASALVPYWQELEATVEWPTEEDAVSKPPTSIAPDTEAPSAAVPLAHGEQPIRVLRCPVTVHALPSLEWPLPSTQDAPALAIATTVSWLSQRIGVPLPGEWTHGRHEVEREGVRLQVEVAPSLFAFRLEHYDPSLPTRTWRVEGTVLADAKGVGGLFGIRLTASDRVQTAPPTLAVPGLVRLLAASPGLMTGDVQWGPPRPVATHHDFFALRRAIEDPTRDYPIWVLPPHAVVEVPHGLTAMAYTAILTPSQLANYEKKLGAIPPAGMQVFAPGLAVAECIEDRADSAAMDVLRTRTLASRDRPAAPSFRDVSVALREAGEAWRTGARTSAPQSLPDDMGATVTEAEPADRNEIQQLFDLALADTEARSRELEEARETIRRLQAQLHAARGTEEAQHEERPAQIPAARHGTPATLADLGIWSASIAPRVVFADKALKAAMRIEHREVPKIYAALQALADHYWEMRWGDDSQARARWLDFLQEQRLRCGPIGQAAENSLYEDAYQAIVDGKKVAMTLHVQGSSSRDPLRCIRIYFHPDDATQRIVVGHLPTHLTNSLT